MGRAEPENAACSPYPFHLSTGRIGDAGKGWRAALKHALGDIAQSEQLAPRGRRRRRAQAEVAPSLELFGDEES